MRRAELRRRCQAILFYSAYARTPRILGSMGFPDEPKKRGLQYAEHLGLEVRAIFKAGVPNDHGEQWEAFLAQVARGPERHILLPDAHCIAGITQWERLVGAVRRAKKVLHFLKGGIVYHRGSALADFMGFRLPGWMMQLHQAESAERRLAREDREALLEFSVVPRRRSPRTK